MPDGRGRVMNGVSVSLVGEYHEVSTIPIPGNNSIVLNFANHSRGNIMVGIEMCPATWRALVLEVLAVEMARQKGEVHAEREQERG